MELWGLLQTLDATCVHSDTSDVCSGLIDEGESAEAAALRELKEETGYKGEVVGVTPGIVAQRLTLHLIALAAFLGCIPSTVWLERFKGQRWKGKRSSMLILISWTHNVGINVTVWMAVTCLDPGLSNCTTQIIMVNINGDEMENINPTQQLGEQTPHSFVHLYIKYPK